LVDLLLCGCEYQNGMLPVKWLACRDNDRSEFMKFTIRKIEGTTLLDHEKHTTVNSYMWKYVRHQAEAFDLALARMISAFGGDYRPIYVVLLNTTYSVWLIY